MNRRDTVLALMALAALSAPPAALAQPKERILRVGFFLSGSRINGRMNEGAFLAGMKNLGYEAGRNLVVYTRYAEGDPARWNAIADELLALKPDVLVVSSTGNTLVMKRKTTTIPIVMGSVGDPVGDGIVESLARPGGNVTGNSLRIVELGAKQIELMAEILPRMRRAVLLTDLSQPKSQQARHAQITNAAAAAKGLTLDVHGISSQEEVRQVLRNPETRKADALLIGASPRFNAQRQEICRGAMGIRLPIVGFSEEWASDGALMSYSANWADAYRRAAYFVDRIFKGAKPSDLPIEEPTRFSLVVNARTAKALGIKIPPSILLRADRVIE